MNDLESLKNIFQDRIFKIPDYQRGYAWTTRQLKDFWEDLVNLPSDRFHYTGLLSLKKVDKNIWNSWNDERWLIEERSFKPFHIVDGQQRLTTFVVFIQAISEQLKSIPENKNKKDEDIYLGSFSLKAIKEEYLVIEKPPQCIVRTYKFGYEADNPSFKFLRHRIFLEANSGTIQETFYTLNLENAKRFFKENLQNYYEKYGLAEIESLFKKVTQNLMFNVYEISDDFDVFVAFETMNNRGKKLSNLELLKNRLIYLTTLYDDIELKSDERISLREKINDAWKEVYYQLGRNKQNPLNDDDFLVAHWIMYFQYTREKGDDYIRFLLEQKFTPQNIYAKTEIKHSSLQEFEEVREDEETDQEEVEINNEDETTVLRSKLSPKEIEDYVNSLKAAAVHWYNIHNPVNNPDLTEEESLWIDRLNRIGIIYFRPLVTVAFLNNDVDSKNRVQLFKAIERFIFITFRLSRAFSTYRNSEFYRAARQLRNNELTIENIIQRLNDRMSYCFYPSENSTESYFDYTYFQKFIDRKFKNGGGFYNWNGLRYFLYEYEMDKVRQRGSQKIDWRLFIKGEKDKVSIEHIYPQTPTHKAWKQSFKGYKDVKRIFFQGTLGNLLPLSQSINSSLQNDCFDDKKNAQYNDANEKIRQGYSDGSHSEIEVSGYEEWNPESILDRGNKLLKFMEKRWDLKFENERSKAELLFLDFMLLQDDIVNLEN
ncbi:DUF262 domain-containing protein [Elizabethkingia anophelis]|uniref:DUF262 domain-containing protein n=1 Tax=Elizabethkingia anophelis TaxID=1117645 RepID=A0AAE4P2S4_9FLAO|nr:DUF262 domain-containing protein [Elizabethkingia anophelis]MCT3950526.1 DUF262 domain-containing protein [Elizabethkingia anophelis]MCT3954069.1 DUF262 domain-containing protein [Elizabethkingia anophelis]MCT3986012.1 DUF262 domain-containing protein [Elizabethkingia anophelis]MCT4064196.1 DUF262 domain-containing protein [Elizabethkingia anophelis]